MQVRIVALLLGFIGLMVLSLLSVGHHMDMTHGTTDCAFASQHENVCPMSVLDHIGAWKSIFMSTVPLLFTVFLVGTVTMAAGIAPYLLRKIRLHTIPVSPRFHQLSVTLYSYIYRALQELFARGILHPKLF